MSNTIAFTSPFSVAASVVFEKFKILYDGDEPQKDEQTLPALFQMRWFRLYSEIPCPSTECGAHAVDSMVVAMQSGDLKHYMSCNVCKRVGFIDRGETTTCKCGSILHEPYEAYHEEEG